MLRPEFRRYTITQVPDTLHVDHSFRSFPTIIPLAAMAADEKYY
jgi:hypothetical protein